MHQHDLSIPALSSVFLIQVEDVETTLDIVKVTFPHREVTEHLMWSWPLRSITRFRSSCECLDWSGGLWDMELCQSVFAEKVKRLEPYCIIHLEIQLIRFSPDTIIKFKCTSDLDRLDLLSDKIIWPLPCIGVGDSWHGNCPTFLSWLFPFLTGPDFTDTLYNSRHGPLGCL